jgi:hypothetical protein
MPPSYDVARDEKKSESSESTSRMRFFVIDQTMMRDRTQSHEQID